MTDRCALLLRAVNVAGSNRVPMAQLRDLLARRVNLQNVSTYIASGNVICDETDDMDALCAAVRTLITQEFQVDTPVIGRTHAQLAETALSNPFPAALDKMVHAMFLEGDASPGAVEQLTVRLQPGERIALVGRELWIDYGTGVAGTKLTRAAFDRALGTPGTGRNLNTVRRLVELTAPQ